MFERIWHWRGKQTVQTTLSSAQAIDQLSVMLKRQKKWIISQSDNTLEFNGSLLNEIFPPHMRAMIAINRGEFRVRKLSDGLVVSYDLQAFEMLLFAVFGFVLFFLFVASNEGLLRGLAVATLAFLWLYGGHWVIAKARIPSLIGKTLR